MLIKQALILAGGFGRRLGDLSAKCPKPMQPINGIPFLENIIWNLKRHSIKEIVISVGYLSDVIENYFKYGESFGVRISYVHEEVPYGTAGAIKLCEKLLDNYFLFLNGDTLFDINYHDLAVNFNTSYLGILGLNFVEDVGRYGEVVTESDIISFFSEKGSSKSGYINSGVSILSKEIINYVDKFPCSLEKDIFPILVKKRKLQAKKYDVFFIDIGLRNTLKIAQTAIPRWKLKPALLLDRDGVINKDKKYVHKIEEFEWICDVKKFIKYANDNSFLVFVITNQAGIGRGFYSEREFHELSQWINNELIKVGAHIDQTYYCPNHPTEGLGVYKKECNFQYLI